MATHYDVLGIDYDASDEAIAGEYEKRKTEMLLALGRLPPAQREEAGGDLAALEAAYEVLGDADRRDAYDEELAERALAEDSPPTASEFTLSDFYDDPRRSKSREIPFGSWRLERSGPWKVYWLEATGELTAFNEADQKARPEVVVITVERDLERLRATLSGWEQHEREPDGLAWLATRCASPEFRTGPT